MLLILCEKCYESYGCRSRFTWNEKRPIRICEACNINKFCVQVEEDAETIGFCPDCMKQGGGL